MSSYLRPLPGGDHYQISVLAFAHVGDAVFELMVRTWLCSVGATTARHIHGEALTYVSARAQAAATERILPELSEEEFDVFKRGRNAHSNNVPRGSSYEEYHTATGLETLFGFLYLNGRFDRLDELFERIISGGKITLGDTRCR